MKKTRQSPAGVSRADRFSAENDRLSSENSAKNTLLVEAAESIGGFKAFTVHLWQINDVHEPVAFGVRMSSTLPEKKAILYIGMRGIGSVGGACEESSARRSAQRFSTLNVRVEPGTFRLVRGWTLRNRGKVSAITLERAGQRASIIKTKRTSQSPRGIRTFSYTLNLTPLRCYSGAGFGKYRALLKTSSNRTWRTVVHCTRASYFTLCECPNRPNCTSKKKKSKTRPKHEWNIRLKRQLLGESWAHFFLQANRFRHRNERFWIGSRSSVIIRHTRSCRFKKDFWAAVQQAGCFISMCVTPIAFSTRWPLVHVVENLAKVSRTLKWSIQPVAPRLKSPFWIFKIFCIL